MRICFFCKIKDRKLLDTIEFYKTDIDCLKEIDDKMVIATKYSEIDWKADILFVWWWTYAWCLLYGNRLRDFTDHTKRQDPLRYRSWYFDRYLPYLWCIRRRCFLCDHLQ